jgi:hypothetical protein
MNTNKRYSPVERERAVRFGQPAEIGKLVRFLLPNEAGFINRNDRYRWRNCRVAP